MRKIRTEDAVGMTLCHDITEIRADFKGPAFRRGHVIRPEDVDHLLNIGKKHIFVWDETAGEVHEEDCARRMAAANPAQWTHYSDVSEGKILLFAEADGMFRIDRDALKRVNAIEDITVATLPDHYPVRKGQRLASMRIVPLVTKEENILEFERISAETPLFSLKPYRNMRAAAVITGSEVWSGRIRDLFEDVIREKLSHYPCEFLGATLCDDDVDMAAAAGQSYMAAGADLILFTGGLSVDPDDITPTAIRRMGADILTHGVPSQPGNMSLVAYAEGSGADLAGAGDAVGTDMDDAGAAGGRSVTILGVPGAAARMKTTVLDVLLSQVFAGERFTMEELRALAEGGLCQICGECHFPNCTFGRY